MAFVPLTIRGVPPSKHDLQEHSVLVILDHGDYARVTSVAIERPPRLGDRFKVNGVTWEISRVKDLQRGYVARPVRAGACVH
jgi:hypothetical protein